MFPAFKGRQDHAGQLELHRLDLPKLLAKLPLDQAANLAEKGVIIHRLSDQGRCKRPLSSPTIQGQALTCRSVQGVCSIKKQTLPTTARLLAQDDSDAAIWTAASDQLKDCFGNHAVPGTTSDATAAPSA